MALEITEALLEMHFHRVIIDAFEAVFGARVLRILKPSQRREAWVGFDQGWIKTSLGTDELYRELRGMISNQSRTTATFYLGYFLQFKVVEEVERRMRQVPLPPPFYRSKLSLRPIPSTGLSQHETLRRLAQIPQASVSYICPCVFDLDDLYNPPDPSLLQIVDVSTSPAGWITQQPHYIAFRSAGDPNPQWCSEPTGGVGSGLITWLQSERAPRRRTGPEMLDFLETAARLSLEGPKTTYYGPYRRNSAAALPQSFTLLTLG